MTRDRVQTLLCVLIVEAIPAWVMLDLRPPAPPRGEAPLTDFSAARALEHVRAVSVEPHPVGTAAHGSVRDYLCGELRRLGIEPEVQRFGENPPFENLIGRIRGTEPGKAILLAAHYDTTPYGPGAADDGAGVATLLETARALKAGATIRRNVFLLFTDGEELNLLGARAFAAGHPAVREAGLVLNFEARGNSGPSIMFETSDGNARLIEEFARAVERPVANSLSREVYELLPNDTDFTVFREAGIPGFNFAFIDGVAAYHEPLDTSDRLSLASLQHQGAQALALVRHFSELEFVDLVSGEAVYFSLPLGFLVTYPAAWVVPLALLALGSWLAIALAGSRKGLLRPRKVFRGVWESAYTLMEGAGGPTIVALGLGWLLEGILPTSEPRGESLRTFIEVMGLWNLALILSLLYHRRRVRRILREESAAGASLFWVLLLLVTSFVLPGASFLFAWPLLAQLPVLAVFMWRGERFGFWPRAILLLVSSLPALALLPQAAYLTFLAFAPAPAFAWLSALGWSFLAFELLVPSFLNQFRVNGTSRTLPQADLRVG